MQRRDGESLHSFAEEGSDQESLLGHEYDGRFITPKAHAGKQTMYASMREFFRDGKWKQFLFLLMGVVIVAAFTTFVSLVIVGVVPVPNAGSAWSHHHVPAGRFFQVR